MVQDDTLKSTARALLEREEKFKSLFNGINEPVFVHQLSAEGFNRFLEVNDIACKRYGFSREEFLQLSPKDISSEHDTETKGSAEGRRKLKEKGSAVFEAIHRTKEGRSFPVEISSNIYDWLGEKVILSIAFDITERKKVEKALSEAYNIINRSLAVVFLWRNEAKWPVEFVSENVEELCGYSVTEFLRGAISYSEIIHDDDLEEVAREVAFFSNDPLVETFTHKPYRIITRSGKTKWLLDHTVIRRNSDSKITHYEGIVYDITKRKLAEEALVESENRHRAISELTSDFSFAFRVNPDGSIERDWVAGALHRLTGYSLHELEDLGGWTQLIFPEDMAIAVSQLNALLANRAETVEYRIINKKGLIRWVKDYSRPTWCNNEKRVVTIEGAVQDITERKLAEDGLRESEEKYRKLIENSSDAIFLIYNGQFDLVNAIFLELFELDVKETRVAGFSFLDFVIEENRALVKKHLDYQSNDSELKSKIEFQCVNTAGKKLLVEATISHFKYKKGMASQGILRDITQKREFEQNLHHSQKMEAIGTLAGGIAHDFNNLLTVINGYSEMALQKIDDNHFLYNNLESILQGGRKAVKLTSQLLAFSRKQIYSTDILEINTVILEMDSLIRRLIGEDINIDTILGRNLSRIKADRSQLEQIFINLVVNARDAVYAKLGKRHKPKITIETGEAVLDGEYIKTHPGSKEGSYVFISVSDNGIGMEEEVKKKIFIPFFSTKGKSKGTGLGLATVYGIVKQNNGSIYIYSEPGQGTTIKIYWPLTTEEPVKAKRMPKDTREIYGTESVLFVEDDKEVSRFTVDSLRSLGYKVTEAVNGREALDLFKSDHKAFDIVVTDLIMPEINGKEFVKLARKINPDINVIYVSGYTDNHIVHDGLLDQGVNFIHKPYSIETLAERIRMILELN